MEFISLKPKITKDFILSSTNQESIMHYYTGLDVSSKKLALSPLRNDHKVTCSFYKSKNGTLYLHDFATNEHLDCWNVVMRINNCSYFDALKIIAQDFGLIESSETVIKSSKPILIESIKESETCKIQVQIKEYSGEEINWWKQFGIDKKLLKKYHVFSLQHVFLNGELKFSSSSNTFIFGYYFGKDKNSNELWKIYFPFNKEHGIRFVNNLSNKKLQGYKQLPETGDLLIITKSMKDCIALKAFGLNAIAPSSESTFCSEKQIEEFKSRFKHILIIYDQDKAGKYNMAKIRKQFPDLNYFVIPKEYKSKDFSDLVMNYGIDKVRELIKEFMSNYKFK